MVGSKGPCLLLFGRIMSIGVRRKDNRPPHQGHYSKGSPEVELLPGVRTWGSRVPDKSRLLCLMAQHNIPNLLEASLLRAVGYSSL